jgi:hypothetical protein
MLEKPSEISIFSVITTTTMTMTQTDWLAGWLADDDDDDDVLIIPQSIKNRVGNRLIENSKLLSIITHFPRLYPVLT